MLDGWLVTILFYVLLFFWSVLYQFCTFFLFYPGKMDFLHCRISVNFKLYFIFFVFYVNMMYLYIFSYLPVSVWVFFRQMDSLYTYHTAFVATTPIVWPLIHIIVRSGKQNFSTNPSLFYFICRTVLVQF